MTPTTPTPEPADVLAREALDLLEAARNAHVLLAASEARALAIAHRKVLAARGVVIADIHRVLAARGAGAPLDVLHEAIAKLTPRPNLQGSPVNAYCTARDDALAIIDRLAADDPGFFGGAPNSGITSTSRHVHDGEWCAACVEHGQTAEPGE